MYERDGNQFVYRDINTGEENLVINTGFFDEWRIDNSSLVWQNYNDGKIYFAYLGPDAISVSKGDISFSTNTPVDNVELVISATVHNISSDNVSEDIIVKLYNGDPADGGSQLGSDQTIAGGINSKSSQDAVFSNLTLPEGPINLYVKCTRAGDDFEMNNKAYKTVNVTDGDTNGPVISNVSIQEENGDGDGIIEVDEEVKISWNLDDDTGIGSTVLKIDGNSKALDGNYYVIEGPLSAGTYSITIDAEDSDDSPESAEQWSGSFKVYVDAPAVDSVSPADAASDIELNSSIAATVNVDIKPGSVTTSSVLIKDSSLAVVDGTVSYNSSERKIVFNPANIFKNNETYTATIKGGGTGIKDTKNDPMASDYIWSFTTIPDTTDPAATITAPVADANLKGVVSIFGTANDANFSNYKLYYGEGAAPDAWTQIGTTQTTPALNNLLGQWGTTGLDGIYTVKLEVTDLPLPASNTASDTVTVLIDNTAPTFGSWVENPADLQENSSDALRITVTLTEAGSGLTGKIPQIDYYATGNQYNGFENMTNESGNTWYFDITNPTWENLGGKTLYYKVKCNDVAGNTGTSAEQTELIDEVNDNPIIAGIPSQNLKFNTSKSPAIDLWTYSSDEETQIDNLTYSVVNISTSNCQVTLEQNRYLNISVVNDWIGTADVTITVEDQGGLTDTSIFSVTSYNINVTETDGSTAVTEGGASDTVSVALTTEPSSDTVLLISSNGQLSASPDTLTFTSTNWDTPQDITVSAVDDNIAEGSHSGSITVTNDNLELFSSISVNVTDNDNAGVSVTESDGSTDVTEGGATDTYSVVLTSEPTDDVVVSVNSDTQLSASPDTLTYDSTNWDTPQYVTVSAFDDDTEEGDHTGNLAHSASSTDSNYDGINIDSINVNITDNNDIDGDGMPDEWETQYNLDPDDDTDAGSDNDSDGLTNFEEYINGTKPDDIDSDDDLMPDGWEVTYNLDPATNDATADADNDGISNLEEYQAGYDPTEPASPSVEACKDITTDITDTKTISLNCTASHPGGKQLNYYDWAMLEYPAGSSAVVTDDDTTTSDAQITPDITGTYKLEVTVTDENNKTAKDTMLINAYKESENVPPTADAGIDRTAITEDDVELFGGNSKDPDRTDELIYTWNIHSQPQGSSASLSTTGTKSPSITPDKAGIYIITLRVEDIDGTQSPEITSDSLGEACVAGDATVYLQVKNPPDSTDNNLPHADAGTDQVTDVDDVVSLDGSLSGDVDNDSITFSWTIAEKPSGSTCTLSGANTESPSLTPDAAGIYKITLTVTDPDGKTDTDTVTVIAGSTTKNVPLADAGADQTLAAVSGVDLAVTLDGSSISDADSDIASYQWVQIEGPVVSLDDLSAIKPGFTLASSRDHRSGVYTFELTVTDSIGLRDTDTVSVTVNTDSEHVPIVSAVEDPAGLEIDTSTEVIVGQDNLIYANVDAGGDIGETLYVYWTQVSGPPAWVSFSSESDTDNLKNEVLVVKPVESGTFVFDVYVDDGKPLSPVKTITFSAISNTAPIADAGTHQTVTDTDNDGTETVTLDGNGSSDPDGAIASYAWTENSTQIATGASDQVSLAVGTHTITLTVTDNNGATATDTVTITVEQGSTTTNDDTANDTTQDQNTFNTPAPSGGGGGGGCAMVEYEQTPEDIMSYFLLHLLTILFIIALSRKGRKKTVKS